MKPDLTVGKSSGVREDWGGGGGIFGKIYLPLCMLGVYIAMVKLCLIACLFASIPVRVFTSLIYVKELA